LTDASPAGPAGDFLDLFLRPGLSSRISFSASAFVTTTNASIADEDDDPSDFEAERREDGEDGGEEREEVDELRDEREEVDLEE